MNSATETGRMSGADTNTSNTPKSDRLYHDIAVIGGGFSGIVTTVNVLTKAKAEGKSVRIILVDPDAPKGRGVAYSTLNDNLLLNVPASNMSAFPDAPDDFKNFCLSIDSSMGASSFVSRRLYGEYLGKVLDDARNTFGSHLECVPGIVDSMERVTRVDPDTKARVTNYVLELRDGSTLTVDSVILAFGHMAPKFAKDIVKGPIDMYSMVLNNPWDDEVLSRTIFNKPVLLLGTGHTATDVHAKLESDNPERPVYLISRRGLKPNGHRPVGEFSKDLAFIDRVTSSVMQTLTETPTVRALVRSVRSWCSNAKTASSKDWRDVINALRTITPSIWQTLSDEERRRFLRHVVPYWDIHRHRVAPGALRRLNNAVTQGRAAVIAGTVVGIRFVPEYKMSVASIRMRGTDRIEEIEIGTVINCTGPSYDISKSTNPLMNYLFIIGLITQDDAKIGMVTYDYQVHKAIKDLYYIGPMLKANHWEAIAVPELRIHAAKLADIVVNNLK